MKRRSQEKNSLTSKKTMDQVLTILERHSKEALQFARKELLGMTIQSKKARMALEYYARNWNATTHPGVLSLASQAVGGKAEATTPLQGAMLLLIAAMDIHDDIIDESESKNGKPTVYGKFGIKMALLIGDALLMKGSMLLEKCRDNLQPETFQSMTQTIENSLFEVGNAHLLEACLEGKPKVEPDKYLRIIEKKASIFEGLTMVGAIVGRGSADQVEALRKYGKLLGLLVFLREEFIDVFEYGELRNRLDHGVPPLPVMYALEDPEVKSTVLKLASKNHEKDISELVEIVFQNKKVVKLKKKMEYLAEQALDILATLETQVRIKACLTLLIQGTLEDL